MIEEADSQALRSRRCRRHKAGDHSLCDASRCRGARDVRDVNEVRAVTGDSAAVALAELLETVPFPEGDPRAVLSVIAARLAAAFDERQTPGLARELRHVLGVIMEHPNEAADRIDELKARRAARLVDGIIDANLRGVSG